MPSYVKERAVIAQPMLRTARLAVLTPGVAQPDAANPAAQPATAKVAAARATTASVRAFTLPPRAAVAHPLRRPIFRWPGIRVLPLLPQPRDKIRVPISPTGVVAAETRFEDPQDPNKHYALPDFCLAEHTVTGQSRLRVAFEKVPPDDPVPANQKWLLTVYFDATKRLADADILSSTPIVLLRFVPPVAGAAAKEMAFAVEPEDGDTWKASLVMVGTTERDQVVSALKDVAYQTHFLVRCVFTAATPHSINPQGVQLYGWRSYTVDVPLNRDPFIIDEGQHPYVYAQVGDASNKVLSVKLHQVEFQERFHHYYQDEASPFQFYYLPDSFKVTRCPEPPYLPQLRVKFRSEDGSLEKMRASLEYVAAPIVNQERLRHARQALRPHLPTPLPTDITDAVFLPLVVDDINQLTLSLAVPRQDVAGAPRQPRPGVVTKLSEDFQDQIADLSLANFQEIFEALFGKSAVVFLGDVQVAGSGGRPAATIPFIARLKDLYGRVLEEFETVAGDGNIQVRLRNSIESPVTVKNIPVQVLADEKMVPASIENLTKGGTAVGFPVGLAPTEELSFTVHPEQPLPAGSLPDAIFGLGDVDVEPDSTAVWNAILDASVPAEYQRSITVLTFAEWFAPDTELMAIAMDFKNGDHVVLKRDLLEAKAKVRMPLSDLVLRNVTESAYTYTMVLIYKTRQVRLEKTDTLDILIPELPA